MKASTKRHIERSIRELVSIGDEIVVRNRSTKEEEGLLTVTYVSREEIHGTIQKDQRWAGTPATFRVPELTQKGGQNFLDLEPAAS